MNAHELQEIFRQIPAGSFAVHVAERPPIAVTHRDFASVSPSGSVLTVWDTEGHFHFIAAASITRVPCEVPAAPTQR